MVNWESLCCYWRTLRSYRGFLSSWERSSHVDLMVFGAGLLSIMYVQHRFPLGYFKNRDIQRPLGWGGRLLGLHWNLLSFYQARSSRVGGAKEDWLLCFLRVLIAGKTHFYCAVPSRKGADVRAMGVSDNINMYLSLSLRLGINRCVWIDRHLLVLLCEEF